MDDVGFLEGLADSHPGIQGGIGVLEDDLQLPPQFLQAMGGKRKEVLPGEPDPAPGSGEEGQEQAAQGGLAAAGFSHQPEGFPFLKGQIDALHGFENRAPAPRSGEVEIAAEILGGEKGFGHIRVSGFWFA